MVGSQVLWMEDFAWVVVTDATWTNLCRVEEIWVVNSLLQEGGIGWDNVWTSWTELVQNSHLWREGRAKAGLECKLF